MKLAEMEDLVLDGEFEELEPQQQLMAPEVTEDNTVEKSKALPTVSQDY
jgi:hypothetical protein